MAKHILRKTTIEEIARFLEDRRKRGQSPGLFLGHRTGGLFNNAYLYASLRGFSLHKFDMLSNTEKSQECFKVLSVYSKEGKKFEEEYIPQMLSEVLSPLNSRDEDRLMASFIKAGFFSTIVTTNIDALLERTCVSLGMEQPYNYRVIVNGVDKSSTIILEKTQYHQIIKAFGDLRLSYNTVGKEFDLEADQTLKVALCSKLAEEILMIGYDPNWDQAIERAFLDQGKMLWYVNEELPSRNTHLKHVLDRRGRYFTGPQVSYRGFLTALNGLIGESLSPDSSKAETNSARSSQSGSRSKAFISYSRKDSEYLERLQIHIKNYWYVYGKDTSLDCWADTQISKGANWKEEIEKALASAKIAVLLVSADFLASDFVRQHELPVILEAAREGKITILSVVLGPCPFKRTQMSDFQTINRDSKPLSDLETQQQEAIWAEAAEVICDLLNAPDEQK